MRVESKIENTWQCLSIQRAGTKEEEEEREVEKRNKEKLEIKHAVGLSNLLKKIVESVSIIYINYRYKYYIFLAILKLSTNNIFCIFF